MIDINLIPQILKRRQKSGFFLPGGFVLPREVIIGLIGGFTVLLVVTHILLQLTIIMAVQKLTQ